MKKYDAIVIGLGAMGSATIHQLAKKGASVLGIDQFTPPHTFGSSHGESRITRQAIAEGKEYVPLVMRANEIWHEMEHEISEELYVRTGILIMASNTSHGSNKFVDDTIAAAEEYSIPHQKVSAADIAARYPQFKVRGDEVGYFEEGAGYLRAEACLRANLRLAEKYGAVLQYGETYVAYKQETDHIVVTTDKAQYHTDKLILTVGPWVQDVLPQSYKDMVKIYRQVLYWFELDGDTSQFNLTRFPVFNWEFGGAHDNFMYGFPSLDGKSIKVATEQYAQTTHPDVVDRNVSKEEIQKMYQEYVAPNLSGVSDRCFRAQACLYSLAPEWKFLIDFHPENSNVIIASPCSGHGFKHSSAIGEVIADMATGDEPRVDISNFIFNAMLHR